MACSGPAFQQGSSPSASGSAGTGANASGGSYQSTGGKKSGGGSDAAGTKSVGGSGGRGGAATGGTSNSSAAGDAAGGAPETPPGISTTGLVLWFKADAGVKIEDGAITGWEDQSGNARDATQPEMNSRPKLTSAAGIPFSVLELDGVDDHLELPSFEPELSEGLSFFAVAGRSHESACSAILELANGPEIDDISFDSLGNSFQFEVVNSTVYAKPDEFPQGQLRLIEVLQSGDPVQPTTELRANGLNVGGGGNQEAPMQLLREQNKIGDSGYSDCTTFPGAIAEIILYGRKLETDERVAVETYLKQKWQCCN